jgi:hypothetical protein
LSKAVKDRLFQPCIEINSNLGEVTGLGLPIARKLAELMGGDIGCKSVVGQGSLYWFTLPAQHLWPEPAKRVWAEAPAASESTAVIQEAPAASEPQATSKAPGPRQQPTLSGHVLVAEDNAVNRALIGTYLSEFGLSHEMVSTGSAAAMSVAAKTYDLVLLDTMMPDLDGIETTRRHPRHACAFSRGADRGPRRPDQEAPLRDLSCGRHGCLRDEADQCSRASCGARSVPHAGATV